MTAPGVLLQAKVLGRSVDPTERNMESLSVELGGVCPKVPGQ